MLAAIRWLAKGLLESQALIDVILQSRFWLVFLVSALFFAGPWLPFLRRVQPFLFLTCSILPFMQTPEAVYGFGLFTVGVILLFLDGFFQTHRILKPILLTVFLMAVLVSSALVRGDNFDTVTGLLFFMATFLVFMILAFQNRVIIFLKQEKPLLRLSDQGLHTREIAYVLTLLEGKTLKEIAFIHHVQESTVRNALSRTYRKLGVHDKAELLVWADKYQIKK